MRLRTLPENSPSLILAQKPSRQLVEDDCLLSDCCSLLLGLSGDLETVEGLLVSPMHSPVVGDTNVGSATPVLSL